MSIGKMKMQPIKLRGARKRQVRTQFGALCYRIRNGKIQVLLITSRRRKRWIVPKGWPMHRATPVKAALREAWEEAGVEGKVMGNALGVYSYVKQDDAGPLPCVVALFPVKVKALADTFPEVGQRRRKWVSPKKAAAMVDMPELAQIILRFDPRPGRVNAA